ncbi:hypothetical protein [Dermatophilus congolensis]|nr:hypothetical protein [Dermatophilus congolensis]
MDDAGEFGVAAGEGVEFVESGVEAFVGGGAFEDAVAEEGVD